MEIFNVHEHENDVQRKPVTSTGTKFNSISGTKDNNILKLNNFL